MRLVETIRWNEARVWLGWRLLIDHAPAAAARPGATLKFLVRLSPHPLASPLPLPLDLSYLLASADPCRT